MTLNTSSSVACPSLLTSSLESAWYGCSSVLCIERNGWGLGIKLTVRCLSSVVSQSTAEVAFLNIYRTVIYLTVLGSGLCQSWDTKVRTQDTGQGLECAVL